MYDSQKRAKSCTEDTFSYRYSRYGLYTMYDDVTKGSRITNGIVWWEDA